MSSRVAVMTGSFSEFGDGKTVVRYGTFHSMGRCAEEHKEEWIADSDHRQLSLMIRPMVGPPRRELQRAAATISDMTIQSRAIHLDDLDADKLERVRPWVHGAFASSPGSFQAVVFVRTTKPVADKLRPWVKGVGSDPGATGSYRLPGSKNWKPQHGGCVAALLIVTFADCWTPDELERSGLLADPEPPSPAPRLPQPREDYDHTWRLRLPTVY